jgi:hypothetical protein
MNLSCKLRRAVMALLVLLVAVSSTLALQAPAAAAPSGQAITVTIAKQWSNDTVGAASSLTVSDAFSAVIGSGVATNDTGSELDSVVSFSTTAGSIIRVDETMSAGNAAAAAQVLTCVEPGDGVTYRYVVGATAAPESNTTGFFGLPLHPAGSGAISCVLGDAALGSNPDLRQACGPDVVLVLDESDSISQRGATADVEAAVRAFVAGLAGTGARMRIVEFATNARDAVIGSSTGFQSVDNVYTQAIDTYLDDTASAESPSGYQPQAADVNESFTNWEGALNRAVINDGPGDLVIFVTDGEPNTISSPVVGYNGVGGALPAMAAGFSIDPINQIKAAGSHMLGVGVGPFAQAAFGFSMLTDVIQNDPQLWQGQGSFDPTTTDVLRVTSYADLPAALRQVVLPLCAPVVEITKIDDAGAPIADWDFTGSVDVTNPVPGEPDQYTWYDPALGLTTDDGTGNDAGQTVSTDADGLARFSWGPETTGDLDQWSSSFAFAEALPPGWRYNGDGSSCVVNGQDANGQPQRTELLITVNSTSTMASFSLSSNDSPYSVRAGDQVECVIQNDRPGTIEVVKQTLPAGTAGQFQFTTNFDVDDPDTELADGESFTSVALPTGNYSVAENPVAGFASSATCSDGSTPDLIDLGPGEHVV